MTAPELFHQPLRLIASAAAPPSKTLFDHIQSGGVIGYVIIALSLAALALIIAHLVTIRETRLAPAEIVERLHELFKRGDVRGAIEYSQAPENDCFFTRVFGTALVRCTRSPFGFLELKTAIEEAGQEQVARLYRSTDGIGLIAAVAPMLGLLGTVVGMVGAFETISTTEGFAKPDELAGNISKALITTVLGLIVAIPCTAVYTYFRNRIDAVTGEVADLVADLSSHLETGAEDQTRAAGRAGAAGRGGAPAGVRPGGAGAPAGARPPTPPGATQQR